MTFIYLLVSPVIKISFKHIIFTKLWLNAEYCEILQILPGKKTKTSKVPQNVGPYFKSWYLSILQLS